MFIIVTKYSILPQSTRDILRERSVVEKMRKERGGAENHDCCVGTKKYFFCWKQCNRSAVGVLDISIVTIVDALRAISSTGFTPVVR